MYNFVFQGNGIIEMGHSNVHGSGTPNKRNKKSPKIYVMCRTYTNGTFETLSQHIFLLFKIQLPNQ